METKLPQTAPKPQIPGAAYPVNLNLKNFKLKQNIQEPPKSDSSNEKRVLRRYNGRRKTQEILNESLPSKVIF